MSDTNIQSAFSEEIGAAMPSDFSMRARLHFAKAVRKLPRFADALFYECEHFCKTKDAALVFAENNLQDERSDLALAEVTNGVDSWSLISCEVLEAYIAHLKGDKSACVDELYDGWAANQPRWILFNLLALDNPNWQEEWFASRVRAPQAVGMCHNADENARSMGEHEGVSPSLKTDCGSHQSVAYGINAQASLMHPCTREVSQTLTVCHQGGDSTGNFALPQTRYVRALSHALAVERRRPRDDGRAVLHRDLRREPRQRVRGVRPHHVASVFLPAPSRQSPNARQWS